MKRGPLSSQQAFSACLIFLVLLDLFYHVQRARFSLQDWVRRQLLDIRGICITCFLGTESRSTLLATAALQDGGA